MGITHVLCELLLKRNGGCVLVRGLEWVCGPTGWGRQLEVCRFASNYRGWPARYVYSARPMPVARVVPVNGESQMADHFWITPPLSPLVALVAVTVIIYAITIHVLSTFHFRTHDILATSSATYFRLQRHWGELATIDAGWPRNVRRMHST